MFTVIFAIFMILVFGNLIRLAVSLAWSILQVIGAVIIVPLLLLALCAAGLVYLALPVVVLIGVGELIEAM